MDGGNKDEDRIVIPRAPLLSRGWKIGLIIAGSVVLLWLVLHYVFDAVYGWRHM